MGTAVTKVAGGNPPAEEDVERSRERANLLGHKIANILPMLERDDIREFENDVRENGILEPVVLYQGRVLDGRNRQRACRAAGVPCSYEEFEGDDEEALRFVISKNLRRRHLTVEQKRYAIAEILKLRPETSNRAVGKTIGADHKTVSVVRDELVGRGEIPHVDRVTDTKGREQPAKKPALIPVRNEVEAKIAEEKAAEENRRETLLRLFTNGCFAVTAWKGDGSLPAIIELLDDETFRGKVTEKLDNIEGLDVAAIKAGADALTKVLTTLSKKAKRGLSSRATAAPVAPAVTPMDLINDIVTDVRFRVIDCVGKLGASDIRILFSVMHQLVDGLEETYKPNAEPVQTNLIDYIVAAE